MTGWWEAQVVPRLVDVSCGMSNLDRLRIQACAGLHGDVLEVGFGSGHNLRHLPPAVSSVTAVEPSEVARRLAGRRHERTALPVRFEGLDGQRLALGDHSHDAALSTFTMCTIPDLSAALSEIRRVLRPGGRLHFLEHGLAPDEAVMRWQRRLTPLQRRLAGGCHLDRPIAALLEAAGFVVGELEQFYGTGPKPFCYFSVGWASSGPVPA